MSEHLELARLELRKDLRRAATSAGFALAGVPLALVGWALLMVAMAVALAARIGSAGAFAIVGLVNLGLGAAVSGFFAARLGGEGLPDLDQNDGRAEGGSSMAADVEAVTRADPSLNVIRSEIDRARNDLELALADLEAVALRLTPAHWRARVAEGFVRHPGRFLAGALIAGFVFGRRGR